MSIRMNFDGQDELISALQRKSQIEYDAIVELSLVEIFNRTKGNNPASGGTPVDTGELRKSSNYSKQLQVVGYTKEYAPHVEYGHRTKGGKFVPGQKFLHKNVEIQAPIFKQDLLEALEDT